MPSQSLWLRKNKNKPKKDNTCVMTLIQTQKGLQHWCVGQPTFATLKCWTCTLPLTTKEVAMSSINCDINEDCNINLCDQTVLFTNLAPHCFPLKYFRPKYELIQTIRTVVTRIRDVLGQIIIATWENNDLSNAQYSGHKKHLFE